MKIKQSLVDLFMRLVPDNILRIIASNTAERLPLESYNFRISFSQQGEDIFLQNLLPRKKGFYVDVGALHPHIYSNTHVFYLNGWRGINIEPNPDSISEFMKLRPGDINLNMAVSVRKGSFTYYRFNHAAVNTLDEEHARHWASQPGYKIMDKIPVNAAPLAAILEDFLPAGKEIDLMTVDCEGSDLDVLRSNNWSRFRPAFLAVEFLYYDYPDFRNAELYRFMVEQGYIFRGITGITIFFSDKSRERNEKGFTS